MVRVVGGAAGGSGFPPVGNLSKAGTSGGRRCESMTAPARRGGHRHPWAFASTSAQEAVAVTNRGSAATSLWDVSPQKARGGARRRCR
jgi:hypothetical protein